jgi:23S rRNA pseudouridine1911/1915/1917 synthase
MLSFRSNQTSRLDKFLATKIDVSRTRIQKAIKDGKVLVDGVIVLDPDYDVTIGSKVELPEFEKDELKPFNLDLKIIFENDDIVVIDKPAGLVVHPGAGNIENTLANVLLVRYPGIEKVGQPHRPGIVHRLDEDTSGLILITKNPKSYEYFKKLFMDRKVEKEYLALVQGVPEKLHGIIDEALEKVPMKQKMKVGFGKEAMTEYFVVAQDRAGQFSLLRVKLHTGRTHQIRAHLAHIGHSIVGDRVYGKPSDLINRQFLHAYHLKFQLPDKTWIEMESELPQNLQEVLNKLGIKHDHKF